MKKCTKCGIPKATSKFHNDKSKSDGKYPRCKDCVFTRPIRVVSKDERRKTLRRFVMKPFGLTDIDYDRMVEEQRGVCAICHRPCRRALSLDHNHTTNQIRGLLCARCNRGLGFFDDSAELLLKAKEYLDAYSSRC
jgi:hypothetical protein